MPTSKAQSAITEVVCGYLRESFADEAARAAHLCGTGAVARLEDRLKRHYGMRHALCVSNATSGLLAVALALGLKRGEFICSPYTYGATLAGWLLLGNKPVFADLDPATLALDPEAVGLVISPRTKAILAVDLFGIPADTVALRKLADAHGLWYIADAAQSLGSHRDGLPGSSLADALVVSFTAGKTVCAGEGGAVLTNHTDLYQKLLWYSQHPQRQRRELGLHLWNEFAINARISPLSAVLAHASFDASLRALAERQARCFRRIEVLNASGLTEPIEFAQREIVPSFFRLSAAWRGRPQEARLLEILRQHGHTLSIEPPPVDLVYEQAAFLAQYRRRFQVPLPCLNAERQAHRRFCLRERRTANRRIQLRKEMGI